MLDHVLVPLDGSALSEQALPYAAEILCNQGTITLVSVVETPLEADYAITDIPITVVGGARAFNEDAYATTHRRVREYLGSVERGLIAKGYKVETIAEMGDPATVVVDIANSHEVDAIVMTTHGRTGFSRWLFGSVTQKVISSMPCPVLVVPGNTKNEHEDAQETEAHAPESTS